MAERMMIDRVRREKEGRGVKGLEGWQREHSYLIDFDQERLDDVAADEFEIGMAPVS